MPKKKIRYTVFYDRKKKAIHCFDHNTQKISYLQQLVVHSGQIVVKVDEKASPKCWLEIL